MAVVAVVMTNTKSIRTIIITLPTRRNIRVATRTTIPITVTVTHK